MIAKNTGMSQVRRRGNYSIGGLTHNGRACDSRKRGRRANDDVTVSLNTVEAEPAKVHNLCHVPSPARQKSRPACQNRRAGRGKEAKRLLQRCGFVMGFQV